MVQPTAMQKQVSNTNDAEDGIDGISDSLEKPAVSEA